MPSRTKKYRARGRHIGAVGDVDPRPKCSVPKQTPLAVIVLLSAMHSQSAVMCVAGRAYSCGSSHCGLSDRNMDCDVRTRWLTAANHRQNSRQHRSSRTRLRASTCG